MTCRHATATDRQTFDDLFPDGPRNTHFACACGWNECCAPGRVPPAPMPLDTAGAHSFLRFHPGGEPKTDYILVRRKYCAPGACTHFQSLSEVKNDGFSENRGLRDQQERTGPG